MKKIISILVIVAMMLASVLAIIPVAAAEPEGTAITNAEEFAGMTAEGKYYLANDITLSASVAEFKGTLDGNGKTITLTGNAPAFKKLVGATVKNVNIVANYESESLGTVYGALAGTANGTFSNIHADVNVKITKPVGTSLGGIFGEVNGTTAISGCSATGSLYTAQSDSDLGGGDRGQGGIIGVVNGGTLTINNCVNEVTVEAYVIRGNNGGIIGLVKAATVTLDSCVNYGNVSSITGGAGGNTHCGNGGIIGQFASPSNATPSLSLKNCRNYGDVYGYKLSMLTLTTQCSAVFSVVYTARSSLPLRVV